MTPQEQKMLDDLMARVDSTRLEEKDPEAAQRIEQWIARNRDAAYILAQTVLVQSYALEQAKAQMQALQQQIQALQQQSQSSQQSKPASFLGSLFGHKEEPPAQQPSYAAPRQPG
ncbi:MAG: putative periplasmic ligand-binding sensor protein, partial [Acidobacteriaceae bacterium]|nr:putative periplasmic ligand-binding sensor protein [Acidobacteriaceae bacterium]